MATVKEQAEALRHALYLGLISSMDVDAWATAQVGEMEHPPHYLLSLATCGRCAPLDIDPQLRAVEGEFDAHVGVCLTLGLLARRFRAGNVSLEWACRILFAYALWCDDLTDEERSCGYEFDDRYTLAVDGSYGSLAAVECDLRKFLAPYEYFAAEFPLNA
jgi:hypothetical protein